MQYTLAQFNGYLYLAQRRARDARRFALLASVASQSGELAQTLLKGLRDDD